MFPSLLFRIVLNRGLEPYGDDDEFYVGVIIALGGNSLRLQFSYKERKRFIRAVFLQEIKKPVRHEAGQASGIRC